MTDSNTVFKVKMMITKLESEAIDDCYEYHKDEIDEGAEHKLPIEDREQIMDWLFDLEFEGEADLAFYTGMLRGYQKVLYAINEAERLAKQGVPETV